MNCYRLERLVSGGQTGVDQLGLEVAWSLGIPTGGVAPKGYLTESGPDERLREYDLTENTSVKYAPRTHSNVSQSDGTLLLGEMTGGTRLTLDLCQRENKPHIVNPTADELRQWLFEYRIKVLNVAGNRGSKLTTEQREHFRRMLVEAVGPAKRLRVLFLPEPQQWGLRGDRYLWQDLARLGETLLLPKTEGELSALLLNLIRNLIDRELNLASDAIIHVPAYSYGGISSGMVHAPFWLEKALPLLCERFRQLE